MMFETDVESTAVHALVSFFSHRMIKRIVLAGCGPFLCNKLLCKMVCVHIFIG